LTVLEQVKIAAPEFRGAALELGRCHDMEVCLDGPAGTGKTYACLYKVHMLLTLYPGAKALVARKTSIALAGSAMATFRELLDPRENVNFYGGSRIKPAAYEYPNGSLMLVSGLDKPEKIKSYEFDIAYLNEATEMDVEDIEFIRSRLRNGKIPYHQLIMDVNPDAPGHWLNQRMNEGTTTRLLSRHEDNPRYFDARTQDWTDEGRNYIFEVLEGLTGVRLARMRYGIWAFSEGAIYQDSWDRARNIIDKWQGFDRHHIPAEWPRFLAIDFGFTNPFVCLWAAIDPDGRIIIYRQLYRTKRLVEDHAQDIKRVSRWGLPGSDPLPREIICDHDAEGRATLERHLGLRTMPAHKAVLEGIQATAARFKASADGKPRVMIMRDCLVERDQELARAKKPTCTEDEPEVYIWHVGTNGVRAKEEPVKESDHGMDSVRYLCARFDLKPLSVAYSQRVY
jgi:PBSX family phage terminase large subunit